MVMMMMMMMVNGELKFVGCAGLGGLVVAFAMPAVVRAA